MDLKIFKAYLNLLIISILWKEVHTNRKKN